jgi:hypothetical protein
VLVMYRELWENINRHILVVWQSVGLLFAAFAAMFLTEAEYLQPDLATALVLVVCFWVIAHAYDASGWFNRNLAIIANIERDFLAPEDQQRIHPYFLRHRPGFLIEHFKIQLGLAVAVGVVALSRHFFDRILAGPLTPFGSEWARWLPYVLLLSGSIMILVLRAHLASQYTRLVGDASN